jgi:hypothetical protein
MREKTIKQFTLGLLILSALILISVAPGKSAPDTCIQTKDLKVPAVHGRVIFSWKGSKEESVPNATIELRQEINDEWKTIAKVKADASGNFDIPQIPPGKYDIYARVDGFRETWARIKVVGASKSKVLEKELVLILGPFVPGACGDARVEKRKSQLLRQRIGTPNNSFNPDRN